jgi:UPF0176 protein
MRPTPPATPPAALLHSAFYRFTPLADPPAAAAMLRGLAQHLHGSIVVAAEGLSGTVAGTSDAVACFEAGLQQALLLDGVLAGMVFKHSACKTAPFGRLKVSVKPEIVALGLPALPSGPPLPPPDEHDASHLAPAAWRRLLAQDGVVLLDNRNHFEFRLGHFRGAVDPQVNNFRDFVAYVQDQAPGWRAAGRPVAMYCTGGIRCDKTAPWLRSLGLAVWQLDGGLLNYFQTEAGDPSALTSGAPPDSVWQGECFVFDKRIALDAQLQETATTAEQVFDAQLPDEAWRLQRAQRLAAPDA